MRNTMYPPGLKNYLKVVPSCTIFLYFLVLHPTTVWNNVNHAKERIEKLYYRRTPFDKYMSRRDDYLRQLYKDKLEWQPATYDNSKRPLSRI